MLIDTHVHLDAFTDGEIEAILGRGHDVGVGFVICAGTTVDSSTRSVDLSRRFHSFFSGVGVHPMDIYKPLTTEDYQILTELASNEPKVIVMSEIGLDYMEGMPRQGVAIYSLQRANQYSQGTEFTYRFSQPRGSSGLS